MEDIEMFYNPKRRHGYSNQISPVEFERPKQIDTRAAYAARFRNARFSGVRP